MAEVAPEYKVIMIGESFVGKTCIVNRFWGKIFNSNEAPTIAASYIQVPLQLKLEDLNRTVDVKLNIWDTAGTEKFQCLVPLYARTADALIVVFDASNLVSFEGAKKWYMKVLEDTGSNPVAVLCANKIDHVSDFNHPESAEWAAKNGLNYMKTSALTGQNISETFYKIAEQLYRAEVKPENRLEPVEKKKSCC